MNRTYTLDIEELAKKATGNWKELESFGWHSQPNDADRWTIFHTKSRDSGLIEQSNADVIDKMLWQFMQGDHPTVIPQHFGHWGCGWMDGYAVKVYNNKGKITKAFQTLAEINDRLGNYPLLDEEDHSRREYESTCDNIHEAGNRFTNDKAPEHWATEVYDWLWNSKEFPHELESRDDRGGWPSEKAVKTSLAALGWLESEDDDE